MTLTNSVCHGLQLRSSHQQLEDLLDLGTRIEFQGEMVGYPMCWLGCMSDHATRLQPASIPSVDDAVALHESIGGHL